MAISEPDGEVVASFWVAGDPVGQGSKTIVTRNGRPRLVESANMGGRNRLTTWRARVQYAAAQVRFRMREPALGPMILSAQFSIERPDGHWSSRGWLRKGKPIAHISKPDLSKLVRAVEDSISDAGIWRDDCQVVGYYGVTKRWAPVSEEAGVQIKIRRA